jgi:hypothetical protein
MSLERDVDRESGRLRLVLATASQHKLHRSALAAERAKRGRGGGGYPRRGRLAGSRRPRSDRKEYSGVVFG